MKRDKFTKLVAEALDDLPRQFRERMENVVVLVEDYPPEQRPSRRPRPRGAGARKPRQLLMGLYVGIPATERSVFDMPLGPDKIILFQKNIEAVCRSEREIREEVRLTVIHELGHYFGMDEDQLRHV